ncbi:rhodanese-like domain-containing protein [Mumia zhuanghuii]|uniref:Rhodanese-like domain-containing protein n=2 Tax=Mumia TaxID=1546255 RepID=A0ABW1QNA0_9ACTN|nr:MULTISPECIES: rhodanese-like domain-containing protein [Mumia]KAA1424926.1 rhodanese-like domain-containing protein [Mumia zhuanghuii]
MEETTIPTVDVAGVPDPVPAGLVVVDVREPDEWASGHIDGALHIPLGDLPTRADEIPADGQVLVYCHVGGRSARATMFLQQRGIDAVNLAGGVIAWHQAGRPLV